VVDGAPLEAEPDLAAWLAPVRLPVERAAAAGRERTAWLRRSVEESVLEQLANSLTYPVVQAARDAGRLDLHGWVYDIETFELRAFDPALDAFISVAPAG